MQKLGDDDRDRMREPLFDKNGRALIRDIGLLGYDDLPTVLRTVTLKRLLQLSKEGRFPQPIQLGSRYSPVAWLSSQVADHLEQKLADHLSGTPNEKWLPKACLRRRRRVKRLEDVPPHGDRTRCAQDGQS